jgi:hypothetical protein
MRAVEEGFRRLGEGRDDVWMDGRLRGSDIMGTDDGGDDAIVFAIIKR